VTRSGGTVAFTSWTPGSAAARFGEVAGRHLPAQDDDLQPPDRWGDEATARDRLAPHAAEVRFELGAVAWAWPSAAAAREESEKSNNFVAAARATLSAERYMHLVDDIEDLMRSLNTASDGGLAYEAEYARIVARKPG
jgi:hypothetical protein